MAWTYSNWVTQTTVELRESQLRLHIQEVSDQITADVAKGGSSRSAGTLQTYLDGLNRKLTELTGASSGRRVYPANMNGSRP